jgi:hypothetical protein
VQKLGRDLPGLSNVAVALKRTDGTRRIRTPRSVDRPWGIAKIGEDLLNTLHGRSLGGVRLDAA